MKKSTNLVTLVGLVSAALGSTLALADNSVNIQTLSPGSGSEFLLNENGAPEVPEGVVEGQSYRRFTLGLNYNYLDSPLVQTDSGANVRTATLVEGIQTVDVIAGVEFNGVFSINLAMPMSMVYEPGSAGDFAQGDLRLFPKVYLSPKDMWLQVAVIPQVWFATGSTQFFTSNGGGYGLLVAAEHNFGSVAVAVNAGYQGFPNAIFQNLDYRQMIPLSLGLSIPFANRWAINAEVENSVLLPASNDSSLTEVYAGVNWRATQIFSLMAGGGVDTFNPNTSGNYRLALGLRFAPFASDAVATPAIAPVAQAPAPAVAPVIAPPPVVERAPPPPTTPVIMTRVVYTPKWIQVRDEIVFENNSEKLLKPSQELLREVSRVLKENRSDYKRIVIEGHANELGSDTHNLALSLRRATAVKRFLVAQGISPKSLHAIGYGKRRPLMSASSGASKETRLVMNRRVLFRVQH